MPGHMSVNNHDELMELLDISLDREFAEYVGSKWYGMDFENTCEKAMEMFTLRQLYQTLRHNKHLYPAEQLDTLAKFKNPLSVDKFRIIGERDMCCCSLDEMRMIFPQLYPNVEATPDIWATETTANQSAATEQEDGAAETTLTM